MSKLKGEDFQRQPSLERHRRFPLIILALGAASLVLFATTKWIQGRNAMSVEHVLAINQIQTKLAISHFWIEKFVSGDTVDLDEVRENLVDSETLLRGIDTQFSASQRLLNEEEQVVASNSLASARSGLAQFALISRQRIEGVDQVEDVGAGSKIDAQFDVVFAATLINLRSLGNVYQTALDRNEVRTRLLNRSIAVAWILIVAVAVGVFLYRERRRIETESALIDSESRLLQSQKLDAVGRLAGGIAHDINNHLAAITMQCEVVKLRATPGDPIIARMDAITAIGAKSATLIKRLLAFSRRQPIQPEVFSLKRIVVSMETMLTRLIGEDIELRVQCSDGLWNVMMDPSQLEQILLNLIVNARDAMPAGGKIDVFVENRTVNETPTRPIAETPGEYVMLTVSDQGSGMPADVIEKIFEPYFTTKDISISSGLGLSTVHGIVAQNSGYITVNSEEGHGTSFELLFPRSENAETIEISRPVVPAPEAIESTRIMVAEDNDELRGATCEILRELGYKVCSAIDGEQALQLFESDEFTFNLVITDVVMPGINGKELADRIRARQPELPIIFVSGYTDDVMLRHGVEAGDVDFLAKPFTAADLAKKVKAALSNG